MSFADRLHHVAIRGCLIIGLFLAFANDGRAQGEPATPPKKSQQQQSAPAPELTVQQAVPDASYYAADCERPKDHDAADLCEQRRMVKAAEDSVWWAALQTKLGIAGFVAVVLSLIFTGWAALAATRAAKAAEATVAVSDRTGMNQLRAYISVVPVEAAYDRTNGVFSLKVQIRNVGQTPAKDARWYTGIAPWFFPLQEDPSGGLPPESPSRSKIIIHPGTEIGATKNFEMDLRQGEALARSPIARLMYIAQVDYFDIFGIERTTRICITLPSEVLSRIVRGGPQQTLHYDWADYHNEAT